MNRSPNIFERVRWMGEFEEKLMDFERRFDELTRQINLIMEYHLSKKMKDEVTIRERILALLSTKKTPSELKKLLPEIKSFGSIAFYLKELQQEGLIEKLPKEYEKQKKTYYVGKIVKSGEDQ